MSSHQTTSLPNDKIVKDFSGWKTKKEILRNKLKGEGL